MGYDQYFGYSTTRPLGFSGYLAGGGSSCGCGGFSATPTFTSLTIPRFSLPVASPLATPVYSTQLQYAAPLVAPVVSAPAYSVPPAPTQIIPPVAQVQYVAPPAQVQPTFQAPSCAPRVLNYSFSSPTPSFAMQQATTQQHLIEGGNIMVADKPMHYNITLSPNTVTVNKPPTIVNKAGTHNVSVSTKDDVITKAPC